jgi:hypothetical protein
MYVSRNPHILLYRVMSVAILSAGGALLITLAAVAFTYLSAELKQRQIQTKYVHTHKYTHTIDCIHTQHPDITCAYTISF